MDESQSRSPVIEPRRSSSCRSSVRTADDDDPATASVSDHVDVDDTDTSQRCAWCGTELNVDDGRAHKLDESGDNDDGRRRPPETETVRQPNAPSLCSATAFDERLSFCSRSCQSRYKMNLFCTETQQYLQQQQQQQQQVINESDDTCSIGKSFVGDKVDQRLLITPDLWNDDEEPKTDIVKKQRTDTTSNDSCTASKTSQHTNHERSAKIHNRKRHLHSPSAVRHDLSSPPITDSPWRQSTRGSEHHQTRVDTSNIRQVSSRGSERDVSVDGKTTRSSMPCPATCVKSEVITDHPQQKQTNDANSRLQSPTSVPWMSARLHAANHAAGLSPFSMFNFPSLQPSSWRFPTQQPAPVTVPITPLMYPPSTAHQPSANTFGMVPPSSLFGGSLWPGMVLPPNTMLVPYPVPLPLPVPIPIPIPIPVPIPSDFGTEQNRNHPSTAVIDRDLSPPGERMSNGDDLAFDRDRDVTECVRLSLHKRSSAVERPPLSTKSSPKNTSTSLNAGTSPSLPLPCRSSPTGSNSVTSSSEMSTSGVLDLSSSGCRLASSPTGQLLDHTRLNKSAAVCSDPSTYNCPQLSLPLPYLARRSLILDAPSVPRSDKDDHSSSPNNGNVNGVNRGRHSLSSAAKKNFSVHRQRKVAFIKTK